MSILLKNISDSDTTLMFTEDSSFPVADGVIQLESEIISYTTNYMGTLYGCTRGFNSTTPASHLAGTSITLTDFYGAASSGSDTGWTLSDPTTTTLEGGITLVDLNNQPLQFGLRGGFPVTLQYDSSAQYLIGSTGGVGGDLLLGSGETLVLTANTTTSFSPNIQMGPTNVIAIDMANGGEHFEFNGPNFVAPYIQTDGSAVADDTRFFLYDINLGSLTRVVVGANDSGGTGFRLLRIVNS